MSRFFVTRRGLFPPSYSRIPEASSVGIETERGAIDLRENLSNETDVIVSTTNGRLILTPDAANMVTIRISDMGGKYESRIQEPDEDDRDRALDALDLLQALSVTVRQPRALRLAHDCDCLSAKIAALEGVIRKAL